MSTYASTDGAIRPLTIIAVCLLAACSKPPQNGFEEVREFGTNPGELRMLKYVPSARKAALPAAGTSSIDGGEPQRREPSAASGAPLVVALHGCMQNAMEYGVRSGWRHLADRWSFLLLLPEQRHGNNLTGCFNWYSPDDHGRDKGEVLSIRQMIDRMRRDHAVDPNRIYVTGVSAGAAMTLALVAVYPEVFAGGAPLAGIAFGCADGLLSALSCMRHPPDKEAAQWGDAVRSATSHKGPWPRISVWQGDADSAVNLANATAIVHQWTNVHGIETQAELAEMPQGQIRRYLDEDRRALVESYLIKGMGHGVPVDPGPHENQCGKAGKFFPDVNICSSLYIARFWGLNREVSTQSDKHESRNPDPSPQ